MQPVTADDLRRREIRLIQIAKRDLQLQDDEYRDLMQTVTGKRSSTELDWTQRKRFLDHLKKLGFKPKTSGTGRKRQAPIARSPDDRHAERWDKARALWTLLAEAGAIQHNTDAALMAYVQRQTQVDAWRFLNGYQINTVIESLKRWCRRLKIQVEHG
ncbi:MAG: hypothetical protein ABS43_03620 [Bordetella sp. SCN 67-23]|nr:regulatory protein GemA [Burkholderiales bacterium]ODS75891.1 MAG: hypothetical protein ABS43_03620 [Bordetella sp. SCN 67-23]OJW91767.1 MAG: hypothetical protein BGO71_21650 [Burkholderiales bacterium 67-32]